MWLSKRCAATPRSLNASPNIALRSLRSVNNAPATSHTPQWLAARQRPPEPAVQPIVLDSYPLPGGGLVVVISVSPGLRFQAVTTATELTAQLAADMIAAATIVNERTPEQ